jgi:hypothetical protein
MTTQTTNYGTRATLACTLASLANNSMRESVARDNTTDKAVDDMVTGKITTGTSPLVDTTITVYIWAGDTTINAGGVTGADAAYTPAGEDKQFAVGAVIVVDATNNHTYEFAIPSIAALFGGVLPLKWGFVIYNTSGVALHATAGNHSLAYTPIKYDFA